MTETSDNGRLNITDNKEYKKQFVKSENNDNGNNN